MFGDDWTDMHGTWCSHVNLVLRILNYAVFDIFAPHTVNVALWFLAEEAFNLFISTGKSRQ